MSVLKHRHIYIYILYLQVEFHNLQIDSQWFYFIALSFFHLTLKVSAKAFSQPHSGTITWYYYYYYFLHFAWESTSCKRDFAETQEWAPFPQCYSIAEILAAAATAAAVQEEDEFLLLQCYNLVYVLAKLHMKNYTILYNTFGVFLYNPV
jgi:hypothetical protein